MPTLAELAELLPADVALALELKTDRFLEIEVAQRLVDELAAAGVRNRTVVLSFSLARVQAVQQARPRPARRLDHPVQGLAYRWRSSAGAALAAVAAQPPLPLAGPPPRPARRSTGPHPRPPAVALQAAALRRRAQRRPSQHPRRAWDGPERPRHLGECAPPVNDLGRQRLSGRLPDLQSSPSAVSHPLWYSLPPSGLPPPHVLQSPPCLIKTQFHPHRLAGGVS